MESDWAMTVGGNGRAVRRYGKRAVFVSSISSRHDEGNDDMDKTAGEENAMRRYGAMRGAMGKRQRWGDTSRLDEPTRMRDDGWKRRRVWNETQ